MRQRGATGALAHARAYTIGDKFLGYFLAGPRPYDDYPQGESMQHFPALFVRKDEGAYRFVICSWGTSGWHEVLVSPVAYDTWSSAHFAGSEAVVNLVHPRNHPSEKITPEVPVFDLKTRDDARASPIRRLQD